MYYYSEFMEDIMRIFLGIIAFLIGIFFFSLNINSLGIIGNLIMHFIAILLAIKGARFAFFYKRVN